MKRLAFLVCASLLAVGVNAQKVLTDDINRTQTTKPSSTTNTHDEEVNYMQSSGGLDYMSIEDGFGLNLNWAFKHLVIDFTTASLDYDYANGSRWTLGLGGQYRYWFSKKLFIEGRLGAQYIHASIKMKSEDIKTKDSKFGIFMTPRLGLELYNGWSIVAGYRWDFIEFKFDKEHTADYFTIGLHYVL